MRVRLFIGNCDAARQAAWERAAAHAGDWLELDYHKPALQTAGNERQERIELSGFVAPDVTPDSACVWLNHARVWMAEHPEAALCGAQVAAPRYERAGWELLYPGLLRSDLISVARSETFPAPYPVQHVVRGIMLARARVCEEIGGFAPELGDSFLADVDLCRRLVAHARAQAGDQAMPIWLIPAPEVACADIDSPPVDEAIFETQAEAFARRQTAQTLPAAEAWFAQGALGETLAAVARVAEVAAGSLEKARQEMYVPADFTFHSRAPVIGPLIAAFRQLWFSVAAKWALRAYRQQQARVNAQHAEAIQALAVSLSQTIALVNQRQAAEAEQHEARIHRTAGRLNQSLLDGA